MEAWVKEIYLRACIRIGELSRELEKAPPAKGHGAGIPAGGKTKAEALADAGISTSAAQRYEELAGGREEQAHVACKAGADAYLANTRAEGEVPTLAGLKAPRLLGVSTPRATSAAAMPVSVAMPAARISVITGQRSAARAVAFANFAAAAMRA
jgi:hypothetical protein